LGIAFKPTFIGMTNNFVLGTDTYKTFDYISSWPLDKDILQKI
jgi:hypothetical protein